MLGAFLDFLARDTASHPERLQAVDTCLVERIETLVGAIEVDIDAPLPAEDES